MKNLILLGVLGIMVTILASAAFCALYILTTTKTSVTMEPTNIVASCPITDYGNGVLHFKCVQSNFGNVLSEYLRTHDNTHVCSIAHDDSNIIGGYGYFVIVSNPLLYGNARC